MVELGALAGMHYGSYLWADPMSGDKATVDNFFKSLGAIEPEFICIDIEQYWQDWKEYQNGHVTKIIDPQRISDNGQYICERLKERTGLEILVYTRAWFVVEHSTPMYNWIDFFKKWFAQYTTDRADLVLSWDTLKNSWLPKTQNPSFTKYYKGNHAWEIWQWTGDKFILPGCSSPNRHLKSERFRVLRGAMNLLREPYKMTLHEVSAGKKRMVARSQPAV